MKPRRFGRTNQSRRRCRSYQSSKNRPGLFAAEQATNQPTNTRNNGESTRKATVLVPSRHLSTKRLV